MFFMEVFISKFLDMFTTRDFAIITWGFAFLLFFLVNKKTCDKTKIILKSILSQTNNRLFVILSGYFVVLTVVFYFLGTKYGEWDTYMVKDAALWFLFSGLPLNIKYIKEKEYFGQLKDTVLENFKVALLFDCVFSTYTFSYLAEMLLVLLIIGLCYTLLRTEDKEEHRKINIAIKTVLMILGFAVVLYVLYATWVHHAEVFSKLIITELSQPFYYTCFFIISAIVLKFLLTRKIIIIQNQPLSLESHNEDRQGLNLSNLFSKLGEIVEKFDIIHFFFERNKYVVKKLYKKTIFFL